MGEGIGSYLQQLRTKQGLTTKQLAQQAGIRRATLSEWQAGKRQPRLPELHAVLNALRASDTQQRTARELLRTPSHVLRLREETAAKHRELVEVAGMAPHGGDLIRAMRLRKGWTQEALAEKMGVSRVTVVRWERAERWLDTGQLHTLCYLLGAQEEELTALMLGRFSLAEQQPALTEEDIWTQLQQIIASRYSASDYALAELRYLSLMAQAWTLAMQSDAGRIVLAGVGVVYADDLFMQHRYGECRKLATHALDLYPPEHWKNYNNPARAAIRLAEASAACGSRQGVESAMSLLQQCLPDASDPSFTGWILSDLARFHAAEGRMEEALRLGREALGVAAQTPHYDDYLHRHFDLVRLLLQAGRVEEAQEMVLPHDHHPYFLLVQAEVAQQAGRQETASRHLERIRTSLETPPNISQREIAFYRPLMENLAESLEGANSGKGEKREGNH
jgi:transcriptional regulator with XRE-family HTH domain